MVVLNLKTKLIKQNKVEFKSRSSVHCLNYHSVSYCISDCRLESQASDDIVNIIFLEHKILLEVKLTQRLILVIESIVGTVCGDMHLKDFLGSIVRVGYRIPVPDYYLVLHGLRC